MRYAAYCFAGFVILIGYLALGFGLLIYKAFTH